MQIVVNGEPVTVESPSTLAALIERLGLGGAACAAEVNRRLVPRRDHGSCELREGDSVELVTLVGGG
jgi:thiamine biosynthesis protein ThiS